MNFPELYRTVVGCAAHFAGPDGEKILERASRAPMHHRRAFLEAMYARLTPRQADAVEALIDLKMRGAL